MLVDFGMGATIENLHRSGSLPQRTEYLKSTVMEGAMLEAVDFSMSADINFCQDNRPQIFLLLLWIF
jgi:hypothetical protein